MPRPAIIVLFFLCLLPWAYYQLPASINGDTAWLLSVAERLLGGGTVLRDFYEVNPPLSYLSLLPTALASRMLDISPVYAAYGYFVLLIALAAALVATILKRWTFLDDDERFALIAAFVAGGTIIPSVSFGERENMLFWGLVPFALAQLSLTWNYVLPRRVLWSALVFGTVAILLKPHFGLVPVALLLHRAAAQKRFFSLVKDADFFCLAAGSVVYALVTLVFFPDYIRTLLPEVFETYLPVWHFATVMPELVKNGLTFLVFLGIEAAFSPLRERKKTLLMMLFGGALLCLVPYAVQMKGFYYHLIPALGLFLCALALSVQSYVRQYLGRVRVVLLAAAIGLPFMLAMMVKPPLTTYPTHRDYKTMAVAQMLQKDCVQPCSFFMFHDSIEVVHQTALYTGSFHASRFPSFWFLPALLLSGDEDVRLRFSGYIAEDLRRFRPSVLLIMKDIMVVRDEPFDFVGFFSQDPRAAAAFAQYEKIDTVRINRSDYFRGTQLGDGAVWTFDVYRRKIGGEM